MGGEATAKARQSLFIVSAMGGKRTLGVLNRGAVENRPLPFWVAYARAVLLFFLALMALDWVAYVVWGKWLE